MHPLLSRAARGAVTSAIRDLLEQAQRPGMISLAGGLPDPAMFPTDHLSDLSGRLLRDHGREVLQYGPTAGREALRDLVAAIMPSALDAGHVIVTTGSQQALHLLGQVVVDPGDTVVVGDPEYLGALQAFRAREADLVALEMDHEGIDVAALAAAVEKGLRPTLVYVVVHFHNPTGSTLSPERRTQLLDLAERHEFLVVFDDPYRELSIDQPVSTEPPAHPLAVELRSVSKVLAPGLRVGWMTGPRWLVDAVEAAKQSADLHTSSLSQALVDEALRADWFPDHLEALRAASRAKRDALNGALRSAYGDRLDINEPSGGMFVWARFTDETDTSELLVEALDRGVAFVPGPAFAVDRDLRSHLRLSWATATPEMMGDAVGRLAG